jgi:3-methylcrotonyl-CoA carboxylase alpha subunit
VKQLLIANRGEIACRIIRSARNAGWHTVAIYSTADANAQHVRMADEAHLIGEAAPELSYLHQDKIIALAKTLGVDAIHPGYGFLSENGQFAHACETAGITFVGPSADAITAMGDKANAKHIMAAAGVPQLKDYRGQDQSLSRLQQAADDLGYPLLIKATCGGGGRGMRVVEQSDQFTSALESARREARAAFGDDRVLLEPYLASPRHVEVQILADKFGHTLYLGDRDCSVQRRHQKVVEEAPAPGLPAQLRQAMGEAAVRAAQAINYAGAGTVEFLLDQQHNFYFMEMNTRLQVEHPVTELICNIDLVRWQLAIAEGLPLTIQQSDVEVRGHAVEVRVCAEDPSAGFMPVSGQLSTLRFPEPDSDSTGVLRIDSGFSEGDQIPNNYDSMLAKVISFADTRQQAVSLLRKSLAHTHISGVSTNLSLLSKILAHPVFAEADPNAQGLDTAFLERYGTIAQLQQPANDICWDMAAIALIKHILNKPLATDPWQSLSGWRINSSRCFSIALQRNESGDNRLDADKNPIRYLTVINQDQPPSKSSKSNDSWVIYEAAPLLSNRCSDKLLPRSYELTGCSTKQLKLRVLDEHKTAPLFTAQLSIEPAKSGLGAEAIVLTLDARGEQSGSRYRFTLANEHPLPEAENSKKDSLVAPLHGTVASLEVSNGEQVSTGQLLMVLEAMKMEYPVRAPHAGTVDQLALSCGDTVERGQQLLSLLALTEDQTDSDNLATPTGAKP